MLHHNLVPPDSSTREMNMPQDRVLCSPYYACEAASLSSQHGDWLGMTVVISLARLFLSLNRSVAPPFLTPCI